MTPPMATEPPHMYAMQASADTQAPTFQTSKFSINGVQARRNKGPKMPTGVAPYATSDLYKSPGYNKPKAKRWDHRMTEECKARQPSSLKAAARYLSKPGLISLGGGLPSSQYFPIEHIDAKFPKAPHFTEAETAELGITERIGKYDIAEGKDIYDLHVALNYGQSNGSAQLLRFLTEHTELVHHPPYQDWQCTMTVGNTSALDMACRMFVNRGDYILTEAFTFASAAETARPLGAIWVGVAMDAEGLLPSSLDSILTNWDPSTHNNKPKPWLLYTVPTGQNPTGATQSLKRRKEIYRVAQKHDIFILEDEPYYFLQMQPYTTHDAPNVPPPASHDDFLHSLVPSLLSLDVDGRVMRMDSFSKVIAPGLRTGWITASEQVVERMIRHCEVSTQMPSGASQAILYKLLDKTWGHDGYLDWLINLRLEYTKRRDNMLYACETYLPREISSWVAPMAGMFHWIKVDWTKHPAAMNGSKTMVDIEDLIFRTIIDNGALTTKGSWFRAEVGNGGNEMFFRATFAAAPEDQVQEAIKRVGDALRQVFGLDSAATGPL